MPDKEHEALWKVQEGLLPVLALAAAAGTVTLSPTQRYAALDAAFCRDVDAQVGPDPPPRFAQFCRQFRDTWNDDVAEMGPEDTELDDDKARPLLVGDQYVARHGGLFPGLRTTPWWDPSEFAWLTPLVEAAPDIANELAHARGVDEIVKEGVEVEVKFPGDAGRYAATILRQVEDDAFLVSYEDGEEETVQRSCIYGKATPWLRRVQQRSAPPPLLEACGFEHVSVATALAMAEPARFARTRAAWRAALDAGLFDVMQWQRRVYGSPRLVGLSRQRPRSVLPAHSDLRNWVLTAHVPLATPAVAGPSALAVLMTLRNTHVGPIWELYLALILAWAATAFILLQASFLQRFLGNRGLMAVERLMGMLLIMLSVDMLLDNLQSVFGHA